MLVGSRSYFTRSETKKERYMAEIAPAVGQVWRGMHPGYGFGHFVEAEIVEATDRRILLKWLDGSGTHHSRPALFGPQHNWSYVRDADRSAA
jgi:hypothetical protein